MSTAILNKITARQTPAIPRKDISLKMYPSMHIDTQ